MPVLASVSQRLYRALGLIGDQQPRDASDPPQRNPPSPLPTFIDFIRARLRLRNKPPAAEQVADAFRTELTAALGQLSSSMASQDWFTLKAGDEQWLDTGIEVQAGDSLTLLADGRLYLSRPLDVAIGPNMGLWYRIEHASGNSPIRKLPTAAAVIEAEQAGRLHLIAAVPGGFADPQGNFDKSLPTLPISGLLSVAVIRWSGDVEAALAAAVAVNPALFEPVFRRQQQPSKPPAGWHYLWRLGQSDIFDTHADHGALCCHTHGNGGILQYPVELPLGDDLSLQWEWKVDQLPSKLPEHIQPTHDYLSIAIEFDNGLDLTYMWSSELAVDTIFQCPLPWWDQRETHWVLRNNPAELGRWLHERRDVQADYRRAIGGSLPEKVVAVWLIANSAFQRGEGDCQYRGIQLQRGDAEVSVVHRE